tara:strand:+ start:581 stop:889 length:309 start_codon:yes stop_codon:yes gene_type:complete
MIHVIATIKIKKGKREKFLEHLRANISNVIEEKGCIEYSPTYDIDVKIDNQTLNANQVTIIEKWKSIYSLQDHLQAPHMISFRKNVKNLVEGTVLKILTNAY